MSAYKYKMWNKRNRKYLFDRREGKVFDTEKKKMNGVNATEVCCVHFDESEEIRPKHSVVRLANVTF
jgi:hypothetical protein